MMKRTNTLILGLFAAAVLLQSCKKDNTAADLTNEFIKRTQAPMIVGTSIDFAYGAGTKTSKLGAFQVIASIPGAAGTAFETVTHRNNNSATDVTTVVGNNSVTNGGTSSVNIIDTNATTIRYSYIIPEAARGQQVSFAFSVTSKNGGNASTTTPNYKVSAMDMVRNLTLVGSATGSRFFSIADMRSYTQAEVDAGNLSGKIDFIYGYAATVSPSATAYTYGHTLFSPAATGYYPTGFTLPATYTKNSTPMEKKVSTQGVYDGQLKNDPNTSIYIDDADLIAQDFTGSANWSLNLSADYSTFMKTADGKYTAFIYINSVSTTGPTMVISMKRIKNF